ncbi:hypothetical protein GCM10009853_065160 [Glycomyces scopariae]
MGSPVRTRLRPAPGRAGGVRRALAAAGGVVSTGPGRRRCEARSAGPVSTIAVVKIVMVGAALPGVEDVAARVTAKSVRSVERRRRTGPGTSSVRTGFRGPELGRRPEGPRGAGTVRGLRRDPDGLHRT